MLILFLQHSIANLLFHKMAVVLIWEKLRIIVIIYGLMAIFLNALELFGTK